MDTKDKSKPVEEVELLECSVCSKDVADNNYFTDIEVEGDTNDILCSECYETIVHCEDCGHTMWFDSEYHRLDSNGCNYCEDCYYETYVSCDGCDDEVNRDDIRLNDNDDNYYCENCFPDNDVDLDSYSNRNMGEDSKSNNIIESMRLVGLEVETITNNWDFWETEDGSNHPNEFRPVHDGSIERGNNGSGVEWVMRTPSNGDDLYNKVSNLTSYLDNSFSINRSCGLHVHIDARDCDWRQLKHILLLGKSVQDVIYKMLPPSRDNGRWCRRIPMSRPDILAIESNDDFIEAWYNSWDVSPSMEKYNDSRYCGMNMHSRIINGSVEFRYHSGTINQDKILNWIKICTAIVDTGIRICYQSTDESSAIISTITERDLTYNEFFKFLRLDKDVKDYVDKRMNKFYNLEKAEDYRVLEYLV